MAKKDIYEPLEEYPKEVIKSLQDITGHSDLICKKFLGASIKSRETTNIKKDILDWIENHFAPNTVMIGKEQYEKICADALKTVVSQNKIDFSGKKRPFFEALTNKISGYMAEYGVVRLAGKHDAHLEVAHEEGNPEDFYGTDFPVINRDGTPRSPNFSMGAKGSGLGALWFEISHSQFVQADFHIFAKSIYEEDHLIGFLLESGYLSFDKMIEKNYLESHSLKKINCQYPFKPIPIYVVGWVENNKRRDEFKYKGKMGRTVFTITEYNGLLPKNYREVVRGNENLGEKTKISFLSIDEFNKSKNTDLHVFNLGSFKKTERQFNSFFGKF